MGVVPDNQAAVRQRPNWVGAGPLFQRVIRLKNKSLICARQRDILH
jgi:hypothetical protein